MCRRLNTRSKSLRFCANSYGCGETPFPPHAFPQTDSKMKTTTISTSTTTETPTPTTVSTSSSQPPQSTSCNAAQIAVCQGSDYACNCLIDKPSGQPICTSSGECIESCNTHLDCINARGPQYRCAYGAIDDMLKFCSAANAGTGFCYDPSSCTSRNPVPGGPSTTASTTAVCSPNPASGSEKPRQELCS